MHQLTDLSTQVCTLGPREAKLYFCPVPDVQLWKALHTWCYFKNLFSKQKFGMERKEQVSGGRAHLSTLSEEAHQHRPGAWPVSRRQWKAEFMTVNLALTLQHSQAHPRGESLKQWHSVGVLIWIASAFFLGQAVTRGQLHHTVTLLGSENTEEGMDYRTWFCNSCSQVSVEERLENVRLTFGEWRRLSCARRGKLVI